MKKVVLSVFALAFGVMNSLAQFSANGGFTYTKWNNDHTEFRPGFSVGASYLLQKDSIPFFGQIGLDFAQKGVNTKDLYENNWGVNTYSLHLPVAVGYKFPINKNISVNPKVGFYGDLGLWGRVSDHDSHADIKPGYESEIVSVDGLNPYTDLSKQTTNNKNFTRFDAGYLVGVNIFLYKSIYLDLGASMGFLGQFSSGLFNHSNSKPISFNISLGYLFLKKKYSEPKTVEI
ncbi:MAG: porin family protein [Paludibacteraceae bacterium]|nr:porin family protein [Paludibacteraceae bacterium]